MQILRYSVGQLQTNCYLLVTDDKCLVIDPGDEGEFILEQIQIKKLKPLAILATHGHFDHVLAVGEIQASFDIPFYIHEKDLFLLKRVKETAEYFLKNKQIILPISNIRNLKIENLLQIENFKLKIFFTPGHTPGSVCYYLPAEVESDATKEGLSIIFTGDTLFKDGIGRYDFFYSSKKDLDNSLKRILSLSKNTVVYSGHGEETTIGEEVINFSIS